MRPALVCPETLLALVALPAAALPAFDFLLAALPAILKLREFSEEINY